MKRAQPSSRRRKPAPDPPPAPVVAGVAVAAPFDQAVSVGSVELAGLVEIIPDAVVVVDRAGAITLVNHQVETMFGWRRDELVGQPLEALLPSHLRGAHAGHREHYFAAPRTRPMGISLDLTGRRRDDTEFPVEISLSPLLIDGTPHALSTIRDVTHTKAIEAAVRAREHEARAARASAEARRLLLQAIIAALPSGVYLVRGAEARLALANRAAQEVWGARWEIGQPMAEFLATIGPQMAREDGRLLAMEELATIRAARDGVATSHTLEIFRRRDGLRLPILLSAVAIDAALLDGASVAPINEREPGALVVLQDVTWLKEAERLKDEFIAIATHELRSPAAVLKGYATMLLRAAGSSLDEGQREAVDAIDQATRQLVELTDELLDLTKLQAGRLELRREPQDLVELARRLTQRAQVTTERHHVTFAADREECVACIDQHRIEQVIGNIIGNAIKYSPDGGDIAVTLTARDDECVIAVRDQGIGIPATQQGRLFQRFVRADNARERGIEGTGLGLYLCREFIERHEGRIWFESREGAGSTFSLVLPLACEAGAECHS